MTLGGAVDEEGRWLTACWLIAPVLRPAARPDDRPSAAEAVTHAGHTMSKVSNQGRGENAATVLDDSAQLCSRSGWQHGLRSVNPSPQGQAESRSRLSEVASWSLSTKKLAGRRRDAKHPCCGAVNP